MALAKLFAKINDFSHICKRYIDERHVQELGVSPMPTITRHVYVREYDERGAT